MNSLEIAELVDTQHGNVRTSIERLAKREVIQLPPTQKVEDKHSLSPNNKTTVYVFAGEQGKRDSIVVVAQLSPEFTARLVDRWQALEAGEATPAYQLQRQTQRKAAQDIPQVLALKLTRVAISAAKALGFKGNQAALSADHAVRTITGQSVLALMGHTALEAEDQEPLLVVTEIAERLGWPPRSVNPKITESGLQTEYRDHKNKLCYELAEKGHAFGVYVDTGKKHENGSPVRQIKWKATVVEFLSQRYPHVEDAA